MIVMCKYCENIGKKSYQYTEGDLMVTQSAKYTYYGDGQEYLIPTNYCPNCGEPIALKRLTCRELLVENVKKKAEAIPDTDELGFNRLVLTLTGEYNISKQVAVELIKYCKSH